MTALDSLILVCTTRAESSLRPIWRTYLVRGDPLDDGRAVLEGVPEKTRESQYKAQSTGLESNAY